MTRLFTRPADTVVFVLAAGRGNRLGPITQRTPKPLVSLGGMSILERNVRTLAAAGFRELVVNTHHLAGQVVAHLGDGSRFGVRIDWSHEPALLGTAGALLARQDRLRERPFVVVYGDNLLRCDVAAPLHAHARSGAVLTVTWIERSECHNSGVLTIGPSGRLVAFVEKPAPEVPVGSPARVNAGLLVADPRVLDFVPSTRPSDLSVDVIPALLDAGEPVGTLPLVGDIVWIDTPADLAQAHLRVSATEDAVTAGAPTNSSER